MDCLTRSTRRFYCHCSFVDVDARKTAAPAAEQISLEKAMIERVALPSRSQRSLKRPYRKIRLQSEARQDTKEPEIEHLSADNETAG